MKKIILFLFVASLVLTSCSKKDDQTYCWEFTVTTYMTVAGKTSTGTAKTTQCGLTEGQAEDVRRSTEMTASSGSSNSYRVVVTKKRV